MDGTSPSQLGPEWAHGGCLASDVLVRMVEGTLPPADVDAALAHVDDCSRCAQVIGTLGTLDGPGRRVGRYELQRVLGVGGMGVVYAAYDPQLQRDVAIKLVRPENTTELAQAMMVAEARTLARISHPNVVAVFDAGEHDGASYLATELVEGKTFTAWHAQPRTTEEIVAVWVQVARGLVAAHAMHVVHRDVKPANVLVGDDGRARIGDFGLAQRANAPVTPAGTLAGTPAYMAPEHRAGHADARSDQFSTCVAIVEALTGQRGVADAPVAIGRPALAAVLRRGLRADPDERFATMAAFADALADAAAPRPLRWRRLGPPMLAAAVALLACRLVTALNAPCAVNGVPDRTWTTRRSAFAPQLARARAPYLDWLGAWAKSTGSLCASLDPGQQQPCLDIAQVGLESLRPQRPARPSVDALALAIALDAMPRVELCSGAAMDDAPRERPGAACGGRDPPCRARRRGHGRVGDRRRRREVARYPGAPRHREARRAGGPDRLRSSRGSRHPVTRAITSSASTAAEPRHATT